MDFEIVIQEYRNFDSEISIFFIKKIGNNRTVF